MEYKNRHYFVFNFYEKFKMRIKQNGRINTMRIICHKDYITKVLKKKAVKYEANLFCKL